MAPSAATIVQGLLVGVGDAPLPWDQFSLPLPSFPIGSTEEHPSHVAAATRVSRCIRRTTACRGGEAEFRSTKKRSIHSGPVSGYASHLCAFKISQATSARMFITSEMTTIHLAALGEKKPRKMAGA